MIRFGKGLLKSPVRSRAARDNWPSNLELHCDTLMSSMDIRMNSHYRSCKLQNKTENQHLILCLPLTFHSFYLFQFLTAREGWPPCQCWVVAACS